jgi:hypothetical protein
MPTSAASDSDLEFTHTLNEWFCSEQLSYFHSFHKGAFNTTGFISNVMGTRSPPLPGHPIIPSSVHLTPCQTVALDYFPLAMLTSM